MFRFMLFQYLELRFKSHSVRLLGTLLGMLGYVSMSFQIARLRRCPRLLICFSVFPNYGLANKILLNLDSKFHDCYLMKCSHNNLTRNDTIKWNSTLHSICNIIKNVNSYRRRTSYQVNWYRRWTSYPWYYNFFFVKNPVHKTYPLSNSSFKNKLFLFTEALDQKYIANSMFNFLSSFCSIKLMLIFISEQHVYLS